MANEWWHRSRTTRESAIASDPAQPASNSIHSVDLPLPQLVLLQASRPADELVRPVQTPYRDFHGVSGITGRPYAPPNPRRGFQASDAFPWGGVLGAESQGVSMDTVNEVTAPTTSILAEGKAISTSLEHLQKAHTTMHSGSPSTSSILIDSGVPITAASPNGGLPATSRHSDTRGEENEELQICMTGGQVFLDVLQRHDPRCLANLKTTTC